MNGEAGDDRILSVGGVTDMVANGGLGNDTIAVIDTPSRGLVLNGNEGDDDLSALGIDATLNGGDGADGISGDVSNSILNGDAGDDTIEAGGTSNILNGGDGDDRISAGGFAIEINGDAGDDDIIYFGTSELHDDPSRFVATIHGG